VKALPSLGRLGWALIGGMIVLVGALSVWPAPLPYSAVIAPASALRAREVPFTAPGPWDIGTRIHYVYLQPDVRAVAPGAVVEDVARFCRPVLVADTVRVPTPSLIRSVSYAPPLWPLSRGSLLVTSVTGHGDLVAEDYRVRAPFGIAAGLEEPYRTIVRYPRLAPLREIATGALWYGAFRLVEAVVRD